MSGSRIAGWLAGSTALASLLTLTPSTAQAQELVSNGGFETAAGSFAPWTHFGATSADGVDGLAPHSGGLAGYFGAIGGTSGIFQNLATTAGETYTFSFWLRDAFAEGNVFSAAWNGASQMNLTTGPSSYTKYSFDLLATSASTEIRFTFQHNQDYWDLDDVSVVGRNAADENSTVPEPATMSLLATGLAGMAGAGVRRRRKQR